VHEGIGDHELVELLGVEAHQEQRDHALQDRREAVDRPVPRDAPDPRAAGGRHARPLSATRWSARSISRALASQEECSSTVARQYESVTAEELRSELGAEFADGVFALAPDQAWHGPLRSLFGVHLVRVTARSEARRPALEEIRERVQAAFDAERRRAANEAAYQALRARYDIVIEIPESVRSQWQLEPPSE